VEENKLSVGIKLGYGSSFLSINLFFIIMSFVLLNYMTDAVGLSAALTGIALMVGRIVDAFYDPLIGYISDRTKTKMGRRRPFMLVGVIPLWIAMVVMFTNPALVAGSGISQIAIFIYTLVVFLIVYIAFSTVSIPYMALAPELTADYNERSSLNGYCFIFAAVGTLLGSALALPIVAMASDKNMGFVLMGLILGAVIFVVTLITVFTVREPANLKPVSSMGFTKSFTEVFRNRPYVIIWLSFVLNMMAVSFASGILIYYFKYVLGAESTVTYAMLALIASSIVFIPVSVMLSKKFGKKLVYGTGFIIFAAMLMVLFFFSHIFGLEFTLISMAIMGIGLGFTQAMPNAIVADAIEYDYLRTGERREGAFFGIWTWGLKMGQALAVLIMGLVLEAMGYIPNLIPQPEMAQLGIRLFLGPISAGIFILAAIILYFYPITETRYKEIRAQIAEMEAGKASTLPLT